MSLASDLALGMRSAEIHSSHQGRFRGATVQLLKTSEGSGTILTHGGFEVEITLNVFILKEDLLSAFNASIQSSGDSFDQTADSDVLLSDNMTSEPKCGERIIIRERKYLIQRITLIEESIYRLELADENR